MENKQDKGFTLVELLIVIVILGILATVTVFAVRGITDRGQENSCAVERKTILTAVEAYYAENRTDPDFAALDNGAYLNDAAADLALTWTLVDATVDADGNITAPANVTANAVDPLVAGSGKCAGFTP